ncbi:hypothetical protein PGT21_020674 [Puccinia graminis f. sp. tritici]|uniref:Uncharacterized protein n=2 Tax=Puccinia graminis f. sp. tritici TaxID=56615 RepID=E3KFB2_PUCGT|nr:uncharacterized protein PGTG_09907 [Puccinia graminis f. sp. tritici CRL 75-36-700-3]XP_003889832.1 hypothetical protein, variant [Puccinia graminis f. sp. tritici CRL 75-36-700-3]EFP82939.2 hypothetical protein PGTG_09907 [Puccinia graminis f. sp. tritici CRL 75-36-700-3]EHS63329.1 hypothetical protein, variant [Puccinia graminis f. sp. tritici CRL 75-36-700-3]KAA1069314.1 hypothetical protein PGT21_020674 [Puccinia graminis f. sp. tritici]
MPALSGTSMHINVRMNPAATVHRLPPTALQAIDPLLVPVRPRMRYERSRFALHSTVSPGRLSHLRRSADDPFVLQLPTYRSHRSRRHSLAVPPQPIPRLDPRLQLFCTHVPCNQGPTNGLRQFATVPPSDPPRSVRCAVIYPPFATPNRFCAVA